ncbi:Asparagine-rich protein (ARP protein) [Massospora cicadina]|nr:Asparagine-rich protein (ARP protein) [Massospora cicadina]
MRRMDQGSVTEIVEVAWMVANPTSLEIFGRSRFFVKCSPEVMKAAVREGLLTEEKVAELETGLSEALDALSETLFRMIISKNLKSRLVTFGANSFRLGFVKEAASKAIQVPNYLKRCPLFDINQEIYKWLGARIQGKYEKFSLSGLAHALNIAHAPFTNALDKCRLMVKIMASILSSTDSKDLFVKLSDMSVDYDQFIEEESRAVLLAGLSPKITQPELMAWFSERGLKPIRLLTIQNPSSGASSGVCCLSSQPILKPSEPFR